MLAGCVTHACVCVCCSICKWAHDELGRFQQWWQWYCGTDPHTAHVQQDTARCWLQWSWSASCQCGRHTLPASWYALFAVTNRVKTTLPRRVVQNMFTSCVVRASVLVHITDSFDCSYPDRSIQLTYLQVLFDTCCV